MTKQKRLLKFKPSLHLKYWIVLAAIVGAYLVYDSSLNEKSHKAILDA